MKEGTGLAEKMLGIPGVVVLDVEEAQAEIVVCVESTRTKATCPSCRRRAEAQDRTEIHLRDLHCFGRPTRLVIRKRRWRCRTKGCIKKTWTEKVPGLVPSPGAHTKSRRRSHPPGRSTVPTGCLCGI